MRWWAGLLLVLAACGAPTVPCGPETCGGCCDTTGQCQDGTTDSVCGDRAGACFDCGMTLTCAEGVCVGGAGGGTGGGSGLQPWQDETVRRHNFVRGAATPTPNPALPVMSWSAPAAAVATAWAANCDFVHNTAQVTYGENLFASTAEPTPTEVVDDWASERAYYTWASNTCASGQACGHYTQLVWRSSVGVGCAVKQCTINSPFGGTSPWFLWVCNYAPPGNYAGQKPY